MEKKNRRRFKLRFSGLYIPIAVLFTIYVLLDTFVLPKEMVSDTAIISTTETVSEIENVSEEEAQDSEESTADETGTEGEDGVYTDYSYTDENISITITTIREYDTTVYLVDIQVSDISYLSTAFAEGTYGRNIKETTSEMAEENQAILAINGDYYGFRNTGYVIRNGVLYRDTESDGEGLAIMEDGTFELFTESETSAEDLLNDGAWQVLSFGPGLLEDGTILVDENTEVGQAMTSNPRTAVGMIEPLHYVFLVSDGRTDESEGLSLYETAQILQDAGCVTAYNLDGGGSSTLWFNGEVINNPTDGRSGGERSVSDIVYIGY